MGTPWGTPRWVPCARAGVTAPLCPQEFSHPVESLALTVEEMINVRRVLVKAEMEKFQQSKELYNSLKKGKVGAGAGWRGPGCPRAALLVLTLPVPAGLLLLPHQVPPLLLALSLPLLQAVSTVPCRAVPYNSAGRVVGGCRGAGLAQQPLSVSPGPSAPPAA